MEIRVEGTLVKLTSNQMTYNGMYGFNTYEEVLTPHELDKLIEKLKEASKEARKKVKP